MKQNTKVSVEILQTKNFNGVFVRCCEYHTATVEILKFQPYGKVGVALPKEKKADCSKRLYGKTFYTDFSMLQVMTT